MAEQNVFIRTNSDLNFQQRAFVRNYFDEDVESNVIPILLDEKKPMPFLRDKSLYIGIAMWNKMTKSKSILPLLRFLHVQLVDSLFCLLLMVKQMLSCWKMLL